MTGRGDQENTAVDQPRRDDLKWAAFGGIAAAIVGFGGMAIVGTASGVEARRLLEGALPTVRFAASSYVAGGATVLALMLTLITFSISLESEFHEIHYRRIHQISRLAAAVIVSSVLLLMFLSFPIGEADVDLGWYQWVYYLTLLGGAVTGGIFISIILMLYYAVRSLIGVGLNPIENELLVGSNPDDEQQSSPVHRQPAGSGSTHEGYAQTDPQRQESQVTASPADQPHPTPEKRRA